MASTFETLLLSQVAFLLNPPRFRGSILSATALSINTNINFTTVSEDSYGGWNNVSFYWAVPVAGLYRVFSQFKWNGTPPSSAPVIILKKTGTNFAQSPNASSTSGFTGMQTTAWVRCAAGDQIAAQIGAAGFTTQADSGPSDNNVMEIDFISQ